MVEERLSRNFTSGEESSDEEAASPIGSVLTVKYKSGSAIDASVLPHNHPITNGIICSLSDDPIDNHQMLHVESASIFFKKPVVKKLKKKIPGRVLCLWAAICLSILLLASICVGVMFWSGSEQQVVVTSAQASSGVNFTSVVSSDFGCQSRSSLGYLDDIFTLGYDISLANPVGKRALARPVLQKSLLHECRLTGDEHCQPHARSKVIDSIGAYHKWIRDQIVLDPNSNDAGDQDVLSCADDDYFRMQAELMSGHILIMTHLNCPLLDVSQPAAPRLEPRFAHQLSLMSDGDQESALDFTEDFGTHYVDGAVIGSQIIIRFTLNRTVTEALRLRNASLTSQATAAGLYLLSRTNASIHLSAKREETALNFLSVSRAQFYSDSSDVVDSVSSMHKALRMPTVLRLRLKSLSSLFKQLDGSSQLSTQWQRTRQLSCLRLQARGFVVECNNSPDPSNSATFVLPFLQVSTNGTSVALRTPWSKCLELCQKDRMCSAATICTVNCDPEAPNCALHRQQEFTNSSVSSHVVTVIPVRQDLRPVTLRQFTIYGHPLYSTNQLSDLASCARLCGRTWHCQIVSFSYYSANHKLCRLFYNMTRNELRQQSTSTVIFMMATFSPCFSGEQTQKKPICTTNAECWHGMCVCKQGFYKNGTNCISISSSRRENEIDVTTRASFVETTSTSTSTSTVAPTSTAAAAESGYYIRGVYVAAKSITSGNATTQVVGDTETTTRASRYKPWQMRSWGGGGGASDASDANDLKDVKDVKKSPQGDKEGATKTSRSYWGLIRGR